MRHLLARELRALQREVEAYMDDSDLWRVSPGISNSAGTLVLHLAGNLQHFIGAVLGNTGYVRDRDAEFTVRRLSKEQLVAEIKTAEQAVDTVLSRIPPDVLEMSYPLPVGGRTLRTADFLLHLVSHVGYHLGQIDYHRRMTTQEAGAIGCLPVAELPKLTS